MQKLVTTSAQSFRDMPEPARRGTAVIESGALVAWSSGTDGTRRSRARWAGTSSVRGSSCRGSGQITMA